MGTCLRPCTFLLEHLSCEAVKQGRMAMHTFISHINPTTGKKEWVKQLEDYDYRQEIARSAYGDMLHDTERNQKYEDALASAIKEMKNRGQQVHVLDIGTGTGLLSMMAARHGADRITACEAFQPMAKCAQQIIEANGWSSKITLIPKRSTEITVGPDGDMKERANILVTEVFDTELIGEGAISTFHHAHQHLLQKDCLVVPNSARLYAQVVKSELVSRWNRVPDVALKNGEVIKVPDEVRECTGTPSVHDLQMTQVSPEIFQPMSDPMQVFSFDYTGKTETAFKGHSIDSFKAENDGTCHAVFMWWDLIMDHQGKINLSCAPLWAHPEPEECQWRDHWMQAVYYPEQPLEVAKGQTVDLHSCHDEYSLWFNVTSHDSNSRKPLGPACRCGAHVALSRSRLGMMSDPRRVSLYSDMLRQVVKSDSVCLCVSDGSLLPLMAAKFGAKQVYVIESSQSCQNLLKKFVAKNDLAGKVKVIEKRPEEVTDDDLDGNQIDLFLSEPYFSSSLLPWHNLYSWYVSRSLSTFLHPAATCVPGKASLWAVGVEFEDLWKIRAPVKNCQGFDLILFDNLIQGAINEVDAVVEPQPLWEYPGVPLTQPIKLMELDLSASPANLNTLTSEGYIPFCWEGRCNGVALWMDFELTPSQTVTFGLLKEVSEGQNLEWDMYTRQGVHLFPSIKDVMPTSSELSYRVDFDPQEGNFTFDFNVHSL